MTIEPITSYRTTDGMLFETEEAARQHVARMTIRELGFDPPTVGDIIRHADRLRIALDLLRPLPPAIVRAA